MKIQLSLDLEDHQWAFRQTFGGNAQTLCCCTEQGKLKCNCAEAGKYKICLIPVTNVESGESKDQLEETFQSDCC